MTRSEKRKISRKSNASQRSRQSSGSAPDARWHNALDHASLQVAVDSCPAGDVLFVPCGVHAVPAGGLLLSRSITLQGEPVPDGEDRAACTNLTMSSGAPGPVIDVSPDTPEGSSIALRDLVLRRCAVVLRGSPARAARAFHGGGEAIRCDVRPGSETVHVDLVIERVTLEA